LSLFAILFLAGLEERVLDDFQSIRLRHGGVVAFLGLEVGEVNMCAQLLFSCMVKLKLNEEWELEI
jgi:hypothetical protein